MRMNDRLGRFAVALACAVPLVVGGRVAAGPTGGALPPALVEAVQVTGSGGVAGIPADAAMVAANVTAVGAEGPGFLTVFACDEDEPPTSNVNYGADGVVPNLVFSRIAADGTICVATLAVTDIIVDIVGYVPAGSSIVGLPVPVRAIDTRGPTGSAPSRAAGSVLELPMAGANGVEPHADVVVINATAVAGSSAGYLTAYPCGAVPATSSVNYLPGQIVSNLVTSRLSPSGTVCIYTLAPVAIVVDVVAYASDGIEPLDAPVRIFDSRAGAAVLPAQAVVDIDIAGRADVPDDASAAVYNLTSTGAQAAGYATSYPCGETQPTSSNLNYRPGATVANGSITKLGVGHLCVFTLAPAHLIVDLVGYARGTSQYVPITPVRALDSRQGWQPTCNWVATRTGDGFPTAFDTVTKQRIVFDVQTFLVPPMAIAPTCDALWVFVPPGGQVGAPDVSGVWRLGFDGTRTRSPLPVPFPFTGVAFSTLTVLDDGTVLMLAGTNLWDVESWTDLGPVIDPSLQIGTDTYTLAQGRLSQDGSTIAALYRAPGDGAPTVLVVSDTDAGVVSVTPVGLLVGDVHPSADGTYVAVDMAPSAPLPAAVRVLTRFGDEVDVLPVASTQATSFGPSTPATSFVGDGSLVTCVPSTGLVAWDLFGEPRVVASAPELDPVSPVFACVGFAR